jgi:hypothetical protein
MSYKGVVEDKATANTPPRSCQNLLASTQELRATFGHKNKETIRAALEQLERDRSRANTDHIFVHSAQGAASWIIEAYSSALNDANDARAQALHLLMAGW